MRTLKPFQVQGVDFLRSRTHAILADEMGLGKTLQAIRAAASLPELADEAKVVVTQASVAGAWLEELRQEQQTAESYVDGIMPRPGRWTIVTWGKLDKIAGLLGYELRWKAGLFVADEAQYAKNMSRRRSLAAMAVAARSDRVWLLSGTPMKNYANELYSLLDMVGVRAPEMDSYFTWRDAFCITEKFKIRQTKRTPAGSFPVEIEVVKEVGDKNEPRLAQILRPVLLRRKMDDVASEIPEMAFQTLTLTVPRELRNRVRVEIDNLARAAGFDGEIREERSPAFMSLCRTLAIVKSKLLAPYLTEQVELHEGQPIVVFSSFLETLDEMGRLVGKKIRTARIDGSVSLARRTTIVQDFQAGKYDILFGQTAAAGVGITLTRSRRVIVNDPPWTAADLDQAAKRVRRIGQTQRTLTQLVQIDHPTDRLIVDHVLGKARAWADLERALDAGNPTINRGP